MVDINFRRINSKSINWYQDYYIMNLNTETQIFLIALIFNQRTFYPDHEIVGWSVIKRFQNIIIGILNLSN